MPITRHAIEPLGLPIHRLLTMEDGKFRRPPPEHSNTAVLYGLDGPQSMKLIRRSQQEEPELVIMHQGVPIRPLYLDPATGKIKRAVPLDWDWGVDYIDLRRAAPHLL